MNHASRWCQWIRLAGCVCKSSRGFIATSLALVATWLAASPTHAVTIEWSTVVSSTGNAPDPATGGLYGRVDSEYRNGKYEATIQQYTDFLNAVDRSAGFGFRRASSVVVPEPSTRAIGAVGIGCAGWGVWRRRQRAGWRWWLFGRRQPSADDDMCGSGLPSRQWLIVARLFDEIAQQAPHAPHQRDRLKPLLETVPKTLRHTPAMRHLEKYVLEGDEACLDLAARALAPGYDNPWLLISKSL